MNTDLRWHNPVAMSVLCLPHWAVVLPPLPQHIPPTRFQRQERGAFYLCAFVSLCEHLPETRALGFPPGAQVVPEESFHQQVQAPEAEEEQGDAGPAHERAQNLRAIQR